MLVINKYYMKDTKEPKKENISSSESTHLQGLSGMPSKSKSMDFMQHSDVNIPSQNMEDNSPMYSGPHYYEFNHEFDKIGEDIRDTVSHTYQNIKTIFTEDDVPNEDKDKLNKWSDYWYGL